MGLLPGAACVFQSGSEIRNRPSQVWRINQNLANQVRSNQEFLSKCFRAEPKPAPPAAATTIQVNIPPVEIGPDICASTQNWDGVRSWFHCHMPEGFVLSDSHIPHNPTDPKYAPVAMRHANRSEMKDQDMTSFLNRIDADHGSVIHISQLIRSFLDRMSPQHQEVELQIMIACIMEQIRKADDMSAVAIQKFACFLYEFLKDDKFINRFAGALNVIFRWSKIGFDPRLLEGETVEDNLRRRSYIFRDISTIEEKQSLKIASMFMLMFRVWIMKDEWIEAYLVPWMDSALCKPPTVELAIAVSGFVKHLRCRMYPKWRDQMSVFYERIVNGVGLVLNMSALKCYGVPMNVILGDEMKREGDGNGCVEVLPDVSYDEYMNEAEQWN
jgi:hypothetical protein